MEMLEKVSEYCLGILTAAAVCWFAVVAGGCMKFGPVPQEEFDYPCSDGEAVFIVCEGNFMYGNATLSVYIPSSGELQNEVFARANGMKLGDVAQSMTMHEGTAYIVVNNSGVIFGIDPETFRIKRVIRGIGSPRYMYFRGQDAYVTSLYEPRIAIVDVPTATVAGYIDTPGHTSTEQMVAFGDTLFVSCWSYDDTVLAVDMVTREVTGEIKLRSQPRYMTSDRFGKLWVLTDGGMGDAQSGTPPALYRIDPASLTVEREFVLRAGDSPKGLDTDGGGETIYFLNEDVWRMDVQADELPAEPFLRSRNTIYYALGVDPRNGDVYVGDAIDYQQQGVVYRFSKEGKGLDTLRVGITPSSFCFRE